MNSEYHYLVVIITIICGKMYALILIVTSFCHRQPYQVVTFTIQCASKIINVILH